MKLGLLIYATGLRFGDVTVKVTHINSNADAPLLSLRAHVGRLIIDFSAVNR
jgi:hypothetical protein